MIEDFKSRKKIQVSIRSVRSDHGFAVVHSIETAIVRRDDGEFGRSPDGIDQVGLGDYAHREGNGRVNPANAIDINSDGTDDRGPVKLPALPLRLVQCNNP
jgi:hypothetical protein